VTAEPEPLPLFDHHALCATCGGQKYVHDPETGEERQCPDCWDEETDGEIPW
jgi:hypothetical protein